MQYLLFGTIVLTALASNIAVMRVGRNHALTVSQHVAKTRANINIFRVLFGTATVCFGLWYYFWLRQNVSLGIVGDASFIAITVCFAGAALIPHIEKTFGGELHNFLAWGLVYLFPVATTSIIWANPDPIVRVSGLVALSAFCVLLGGYIFIRSQRHYFLYYQVAYVLVFFAYLTLLTLYV